MGNPVDSYLAALDSKDWAGLASTLASRFERIGPFAGLFQSEARRQVRRDPSGLE